MRITILTYLSALMLQGAISMTIYLYVKTHNKTGLKYLGKTINKDPHKYSGSGKYWKRHLKQHGNDYTTDIIKECHSEDELIKWGLYYSNLWNIVTSDEWANLKEEAGQGGRLSEGTRKKISDAGKGRIHSTKTKEKMSNADRSSYNRIAPVSESTKKKLSDSGKRHPGNSTGYKWTPEQKAVLSQKRKGQPCPTKGMKREYRIDGSFYFVKSVD